MSAPNIDQPQTKMGCVILILLIVGSIALAYFAVTIVQAV